MGIYVTRYLRVQVEGVRLYRLGDAVSSVVSFHSGFGINYNSSESGQT